MSSSSSTPPVPPPSQSQKVIQSDEDDREFRTLKLKNGLDVVLIRDDSIGKSHLFENRNDDDDDRFSHRSYEKKNVLDSHSNDSSQPFTTLPSAYIYTLFKIFSLFLISHIRKSKRDDDNDNRIALKKNLLNQMTYVTIIDIDNDNDSAF